MTTRRALVLLLVFTTSACVTTGAFDAKVAELDALREQHDRDAAAQTKALKANTDAKVADLNAQLSRAKKDLTDSAA